MAIDINTLPYCSQYQNAFVIDNTLPYSFAMKNITATILDKLMKDHGHNAYDLERLSGVPQPTIHRILRGKHGEPRKSTLDRIAVVYGLTAGHLRGEIPIDEQKNAKTYVVSDPAKQAIIEMILAMSSTDAENLKVTELIAELQKHNRKIKEINDRTTDTRLGGFFIARKPPLSGFFVSWFWGITKK